MANQVMEKQLKVALSEKLCVEENFWKLKSRKEWITTSDLNTKHFHLSTIIQRRCNAIEFLKIEDDSWISSWDQIGDHIVHFFQALFSSSDPSPLEDLEHLIDPIISLDQNAMLSSIPSDLEIFEGLRDIDSNKSSGLDGMTALFFKHY